MTTGTTTGETPVSARSITEDDLNYYVHGYNDEYPQGYKANYLTVPKYAARRKETNRDHPG